jgi:ribosomal protein L19E
MIGRILVAVLLTVTMATPIFANPKSPGVDRREHKQKQRIKQGVRSGQLTREEAQSLAAEQRAIRAKEREIRSDGVVTPKERRELHQDLNESSQHIFQEKHDAETR